MPSLVVSHVNGKLKELEHQLAVMIFSIGMAWVMGLVLPTVFLI